MAQPSAPKVFDEGWEFSSPSAGNDALVADASDRVFIEIHNTAGSVNTAFHADIYNLGDYPGGSIISGGYLPVEGGQPQFFDASLSAGTVHAGKTGTSNKTVVGSALHNDGTWGVPIAFDFEAYQSGSVADCAVAAARPPALAGAGKPVPAALRLQLDGPADEPPPPTTLRYAGTSGPDCCWLSQPIDSCSDQSDLAFWMLRTSDARTWVLFLRRGTTDVVVYHGGVGEGDAFSLRLAAGGPDSQWPCTVTISPAP